MIVVDFHMSEVILNETEIVTEQILGTILKIVEMTGEEGVKIINPSASRLDKGRTALRVIREVILFLWVPGRTDGHLSLQTVKPLLQMWRLGSFCESLSKFKECGLKKLEQPGKPAPGATVQNF